MANEVNLNRENTSTEASAKDVLDMMPKSILKEKNR